MATSWFLAVVCSTLLCLISGQGIKVGDLETHFHLVSGTVYAVSLNQLRITNFNYDGTGPDAFFWVGVRGVEAEVPDATGKIVPDEFKRSVKLGEYINKDIVITLPDGLMVWDLKWMSVWCRAFKMNYGDIYFPDDLEGRVPRPVNVGQFSELGHEVKSGEVTIEDTKTFLIRDLYYDGLGPDAYFLVGKGEPNGAGTKVPDETGSLSVLGPYNGKTIRLSLPGALTMADIDWIAIYCVKYSVDFGNMRIPANLNVPLHVKILNPYNAPLFNCEELHERLQVSWGLYNDNITLEFASILAEDEYMSFGVSGVAGKSAMIGSRAVVVMYDERGPMAFDYTLTAYSQCTGEKGVCPVTVLGGTNMVEIVEGARSDGVTRVRVTRPMWTAGNFSLVDEDVDIVWAIGQYQRDVDLIKMHDIRIKENKKTNFSRDEADHCSPLVAPASTQMAPWPIEKISGEDINVFHAIIGPSYGQRGDHPVTGHMPQDFVWYINMALLPELTVRRGDNYTFIVEGGDETYNREEFYPFYITDSPSGGYGQMMEEGQESDETIFTGLDEFGFEKTHAVGRFCQWKKPEGIKVQDFNTFDKFFEQLTLDCRSGRPGIHTWTPDQDTPDTVYYQSYVKKYVGWKINVVDDYVSGADMKKLNLGTLCALAVSIYLVTIIH